MRASEIIKVPMIDITTVQTDTLPDSTDTFSYYFMNGEAILGLPGGDNVLNGGFLGQWVLYVLDGRLIDDDTKQPMATEHIEHFINTEPSMAAYIAFKIKNASDARINELVESIKTVKNASIPTPPISL